MVNGERGASGGELGLADFREAAFLKLTRKTNWSFRGCDFGSYEMHQGFKLGFPGPCMEYSHRRSCHRSR